MKKNGTKQIGLFASVVIMVIIVITASAGGYHIALLMGASKSVASNIALVPFAFVIALFAHAGGIAGIAFAAIAVFGVTVAAIVVFAVFGVTVVADKLGVPYGWVLMAYTLEAVTILAAVMAGSVMGSMAIALVGIAAILLLWRWYQVKHGGMTAQTTLAH